MRPIDMILVVSTALLLTANLSACRTSSADSDASSMLPPESEVTEFNASHCDQGLPGWIRGEGNTRDLVPPCSTSSGGQCPEDGFEYVSGTGWCKPVEATTFGPQHCRDGLPGWIRGEGYTRDLVPPCFTSSGGGCPDEGFEYVSGTGWCKPVGATTFGPMHCRDGLPGWIRGEGTTRDLVPPCSTSSGGQCPEDGFEYVSGTGWCKPIAD